jgi:hypothetical protein
MAETGFQDTVLNWPYKLPLQSMDEYSYSSDTEVKVSSFINHKIALAALWN